MLEQYFLYEICDGLRNVAQEYRERPFFMDHLKEPSLFHCNFERVDENRYPSVRSDRFREIFSKRVRAHREQREGMITYRLSSAHPHRYTLLP
jgi:hypothetical protein